MEASQLDAIRCVMEEHVQDLRRMMQEFTAKTAGSDNPGGDRASQSVDRPSPNDTLQPRGATTTSAHGGTTVPAEDSTTAPAISEDASAPPATAAEYANPGSRMSGAQGRRIRALRSPSPVTSGAEDATASPPGSPGAEDSSASLAIAVSLARQALQQAESILLDAQADAALAKASEQVREAWELLAADRAGWIPSTRQTAQAYDLVGEARQLVKSSWVEKLVMDVALTVREVLVLQCCLGSSCGRLGSDSAFNASIIIAFDRELESTLNSQMHLSRRTIIRLGSEWGKFKSSVHKIYRQQVNDEDSVQLFSIYNAVSVASKGKKAKAPRPAKEKGAGPQTQTASECPQTQHASKGEHAQTGNMGADGEQAAAGSKGEHPQYPWNMGDPLKASMPSSNFGPPLSVNMGDPLKVSMPSSNFGPPLSVFEGSGGGLLIDEMMRDIWGTSRCGACGAIL